MTPFYTAEGDSGKTGFLGEGRLSKSSPRIEAVGSVDEATAYLGLARSMAESEQTKALLLSIQKTLYHLMVELASDPDVSDRFKSMAKADVRWLESQVAALEDKVDLPREFIIPGETRASGALSVARTVVRRAERRCVALYETGGITNSHLIAYLNRLSSLIFLLEVYEAGFSGREIHLAKES
jgi:cob(I)alamin adenosyltransferase